MTQLIEILSSPRLTSFSTAQQCLDWLNETTTVPGDATPYTWSGVAAKLIANGASASDVMAMAQNVGTLPGGAILNACLLSGGLNFADATNRALIQSEEVNQPTWAVNILNAMLAIGAPQTVTNWKLLGLPQQPQLADIQSILLQRMIGNVIGPIQQAIHSGTLTTVADVAAAAAAAFAIQQTNLGG